MQRYRYPTLLMVLALAACSSVPTRGPSRAAPAGGGSSSGGYYLDDGPGANPPPNLDAVPDAVPRLEPLSAAANRPYTVLGQEYVPATTLKPYHEVGLASWYGRRYNGQRTSIGEIYDMYAMTAAHPTLPLPSYARVTNLATGKSVVVRVNDRGPFLRGRIIDLSYAAAYKLGIAKNGSGEVAVDALLPDAGMQLARAATPAAAPVEASVGARVEAPVVATPASVAASATLPTAVARPELLPVAATPGGFTVQLGAFANYSNARAFLAHVENQLAQAQVEPRIRQAGGLYRVYVGPYPAHDEAWRMGERITRAFGFPTTVAPN
ncbi:MAG TPA: septal ring lytic transglycosylase RlpA family protein [Casimicrobiaceae bacterium]|nr:septal ring lytic transglycosylase RlpA family protein [Casimicrobiaceae bacterium]